MGIGLAILFRLVLLFALIQLIEFFFKTRSLRCNGQVYRN